MTRPLVIASLWLLALFAAFHGGKAAHHSGVKFINSKTSSRSPIPVTLPPRDFAKASLALTTNAQFQETFQSLLAKQTTGNASDDLFLLADLWASKDPSAANAWLAKLQLDDSRNPCLFSALSQWAMQNPAAATAFLDSLPNANRDYLLAALVRGLATRDPDAALQLLLAAPSSPEKIGALDFILTAWSQISLQHAFEKIATTFALKEQAIQKLTATLTTEQLAEARTWALSLTSPSDRQTALTGIAARWSQSDPVAATAWATQLPDPQIQSLALGETAARWARIDPPAASAWLTQNSGLATTDLAARSIAWSTVGLDPNLAFSQISNITHDTLRDESFEQIGRLWLSRDPQTAKAFFENKSPLPPAIRQTLLESFE